MRRVYKNLCPATISASIMAANMWKNSLKNVESDNNKILYETLLNFFYSKMVLTFWISLITLTLKTFKSLPISYPQVGRWHHHFYLKLIHTLQRYLDYSYHNGTHHRYPTFVVYSIQQWERASQLFNSYYFTEAQILSYLNNWTLSWYQYTFIMILLEHSQRWMGHNDLFFMHL